MNVRDFDGRMLQNDPILQSLFMIRRHWRRDLMEIGPTEIQIGIGYDYLLRNLTFDLI